MPVVGELIPSGVSKHVRVDREWQLRGLTGPGDHLQESGGRGRTAALGNKNVSRFHVLAS
jgi:hypothetical protein